MLLYVTCVVYSVYNVYMSHVPVHAFKYKNSNLITILHLELVMIRQEQRSTFVLLDFRKLFSIPTNLKIKLSTCIWQFVSDFFSQIVRSG